MTYALAEGGADWPYVSLPFDQFEKHARRVTSFPYNGIASVTPIVTNVTAWNKYCADIMSGSDIPMSPGMFSYDKNGVSLVTGAGRFLPIHHVYPTPAFITSINGSIVNYDFSSDTELNSSATMAYNYDQIVLSGLLSSALVRDAYPDIFDTTEPISMLIKPIHSSSEETPYIVGYAQSIFKWKSMFSNFYDTAPLLYCTVENTCGESFSFVIENHNVTFVDSEYSTDLWTKDISFTSAIAIKYDNVSLEDARGAGICTYSLTVYPSAKFRQEYDFKARTYSIVVGLILVFNLSTFFAFD
jgi:hypothetical protein